jgi:hypothetical protein
MHLQSRWIAGLFGKFPVASANLAQAERRRKSGIVLSIVVIGSILKSPTLENFQWAPSEFA